MLSLSATILKNSPLFLKWCLRTRGRQCPDVFYPCSNWCAVYSFECNEIYIIPRVSFPDVLFGKTFAECTQMLFENRDRNNPIILLGIRRQDRVIMNPKPDASEFGHQESRIEEEDALIAMGLSTPDLTVSFNFCSGIQCLV